MTWSIPQTWYPRSLLLDDDSAATVRQHEIMNTPLLIGETAPAAADRAGPATLLFLLADTGGGHRRAAEAVSRALDQRFLGQLVAAMWNPLAGPQSCCLVRRVTNLYGPLVRRAPRLWGAVYRLSDSPGAVDFLHRRVFARVSYSIADAIIAHQPAAIVSFHPLTHAGAIEARRRIDRDIPIVTVVTDLVTAHCAWRDPRVDRILVPSAAVRWRFHLDGVPADRVVETGLPVAPGLGATPVTPAERRAFRRNLGMVSGRFLVLVAGGAEGTGGMAAQVEAMVDQFSDIDVVAVCGRNERLRGRLNRLARQRGRSRLHALGYVDNLDQWMRAAEVVVTKAGPGTIAEAACCGAAMLLTGELPGQEAGNIDFVVRTGAGRRATTLPELIEEISRLRRHPELLEAMRAAAWRLGRADAASDIACILAHLVGVDHPKFSAAAISASAERGTGGR
jgi:1,2-diacylglycerol 3-beta-galactosyltransferase